MRLRPSLALGSFALLLLSAFAACVGEDPRPSSSERPPDSGSPPVIEKPDVEKPVEKPDVEAPDASDGEDAGTSADAAEDAAPADADAGPQLCGDSGHGCAGGPCVNGQCGRVTIAAGQNHPYGIVVDDDGTVFWINRGSIEVSTDDCSGADGAVMRRGPNDAQPIAIATDQKCPADLVLVGSGATRSILWLNKGTAPGFDDGEVRSASVAGGSLTTRVTNLKKPTGFTADSQFIFIHNSKDGTLVRTSIGGGVQTLLASAPSTGAVPNAQWQNARGVTQDGEFVYWFDGTQQRSLHRLARDAGSSDAGAPALLTAELYAGSLVMSPDRKHLAWVNMQNSSGWPARVADVVDGGVGDASTIGVTYFPHAVALENDRAYWGYVAIHTTPLAIADGGPGSYMVTGGLAMRSMAVRREGPGPIFTSVVYWVDASGFVYQLARN